MPVIRRRKTMRKRISLIAAVVIIFSSSYCLAAPKIPNLVGKWKVKVEGQSMTREADVGEKTHWAIGQEALEAEATITEQKGRRLKGTITSNKATENFIGVVGPDNRKIYISDEDGFADMEVIDKDKLQTVYRHVTPKDSVAAVGMWIRKK